MLSINLHLASPRQTRAHSLSRNGYIERKRSNTSHPPISLKCPHWIVFVKKCATWENIFLWLTHWDFCFTTAVFNWNTLALLKIKAIRQMHEKCEEEKIFFNRVRCSSQEFFLNFFMNSRVLENRFVSSRCFLSFLDFSYWSKSKNFNSFLTQNPSWVNF